MIAAYADPPYLGQGRKHYSAHHPEAAVWDSLDAHRDLIEQLGTYDAWALSASTPSLRVLLPMCPEDARVAAWVKPFASFKPNVNPAYAWEPVIFRTTRRRSRDEMTVRDWVSANITLQRGLTGVKPPQFCHWLFDLLGLQPGDEFHDLFPGSGAVTEAWERRCLRTEAAL